MEKNSKRRSRSMCERLFRAIKVSPSFRKFGQISNTNLDKPAAPKLHSKPVELVLEGSPISTPDQNGKIRNKIVAPAKAKAHDMAQIVPGKDDFVAKYGPTENVISTDDINERFTEFINRAKLKIRTVSNAGTESNIVTARSDSVNDKAFDYINRAKMRIRTTSSNLGKYNVYEK